MAAKPYLEQLFIKRSRKGELNHGYLLNDGSGAAAFGLRGLSRASPSIGKVFCFSIDAFFITFFCFVERLYRIGGGDSYSPDGLEDRFELALVKRDMMI